MYDTAKPVEQYLSYFDDLSVVTRRGWVPHNAHDVLVLRLDLAHPTLQSENLKKSLKAYVENQIAQFFSKYADKINGCKWTAWSGENPGTTVHHLARDLKYSHSPELYVIVENATAPLHLLDSTGNSQGILQTFFAELSTGQRHDEFAGIIATAYLEGDATTNTHFDGIFSCGYLDVTNHPYSQECFGFTKRGIDDLVIATVKITRPDAPDIWETLQEKVIVAKQWSNPDVTPEGMSRYGPPSYSMKSVLQVIAERCGQQNAQPL